jgi:hypothetical protein
MGKGISTTVIIVVVALAVASLYLSSSFQFNIQPESEQKTETTPTEITPKEVPKSSEDNKIPAQEQKSPTPPGEFGHSEQVQPVSSSRQNPELPSDKEKQQLAECSGKTFSVDPVDLGKITEIVPLGNLAPPGHTFPTEHTYLHITPGGTTTDTIPLYAPADVQLLLISFSHGITQDPVDYTLYFALCKDVIGYYNHVKEISPELEKIVSETNCMFQGEDKSKRCNIQAFTPIKAGRNMGSVGRLQGNFDFGLIDLSKPLKFANPDRYGTRSFYINCAYDYYDDASKGKFYNLLSRKDGKCGTTAQDVSGTLKGNWFYGNSRADMGADWDKYLAFVQDNKDPAKSVISVGGVFTNVGKLEFTPQSLRLVNREFTQVTPDGNVYCYEGSSMSGRITVQLTSATELKIEHQDGSCSGSLAFVKPTVYSR